MFIEEINVINAFIGLLYVDVVQCGTYYYRISGVLGNHTVVHTLKLFTTPLINWVRTQCIYILRGGGLFLSNIESHISSQAGMIPRKALPPPPVPFNKSQGDGRYLVLTGSNLIP